MVATKTLAWARLTLGAVLVATLVTWALPCVEQLASVQRFLGPARERNLDVSALYYTELPQTEAAVTYLQARMRAADSK